MTQKILVDQKEEDLSVYVAWRARVSLRLESGVVVDRLDTMESTRRAQAGTGSVSASAAGCARMREGRIVLGVRSRGDNVCPGAESQGVSKVRHECIRCCVCKM